MTLYVVALSQGCFKETIQKKAGNLNLAHANPFPPLMVFATSRELQCLLVPYVLDVLASGVHSILYLYLVVKFKWSAVTVGLFFSCVGAVTALTQGVLVPSLIPAVFTCRVYR